MAFEHPPALLMKYFNTQKTKYDLTSLIIVDIIIYTKAKCELTI